MTLPVPDAAERYRRFLETLTPESLVDLEEYVAADVRFVDPFNDVTGCDAMRRVFVHMFKNIGDVRFSIHHMMAVGNTCLMHWRFAGILRGAPWTFDGTSVVTFDADGRVITHLDHWDAARAFYERLPVIGWLLARIRARIARA